MTGAESAAYAKGVLVGVLGTLLLPHLWSALSRRKSKRCLPQLQDSVELPLRLLSKAEGVLQYRSSLVIVIERCVNDFNYSAILRTAEALGVQDVWLVDPPRTEFVKGPINCDEDDDLDSCPSLLNDANDSSDVHGRGGSDSSKPENATKAPRSILSPQEKEQRRLHHLFARKATSWLTLREFSTSNDCIEALRSEGYQVWATDLSQVAVPLTKENLPVLAPRKLALVFGTEAVGVSQEMLQHADLRVYLPLRGFADSLNLSVATALVVHQIFTLYPQLIGSYSEKNRLRESWYSMLASQRMWTPKQKKMHRKLLSTVEDCLNYKKKQNHGGILTKDQIQKLDRLSEYESQLLSLERERQTCDSILHYIKNPPPPLMDLRRADAHRITYVGKNTKILHAQHWQGMVAISKVPTVHMVTSKFFRGKQHHEHNSDRYANSRISSAIVD